MTTPMPTKDQFAAADAIIAMLSIYERWPEGRAEVANVLRRREQAAFERGREQG